MRLVKWDELPDSMKNDEVRKYYCILSKKKTSLFFKRLFDVTVSAIMLIVSSPLFLILGIAIKLESSGPVFYRQERVTQYGKVFRIFKFRTMIQDADKKGTLVTVGNDSRITKVGSFIRKCRLDEVPQLLDVFRGTMTFVGVRPEVKRYVDCYDDAMLATLLLPAGVTNETCIYYKDEAELLADVEDVDDVYIHKVMPKKMFYNLKAIENFSFWGDIKVMFMTVLAVMGKEYDEN